MSDPAYETERGLLFVLQARVNLMSQRTVAHVLGFSPQYLNDVLKGRRDVSEALAQKLGYERVMLYRKVR